MQDGGNCQKKYQQRKGKITACISVGGYRWPLLVMKHGQPRRDVPVALLTRAASAFVAHLPSESEQVCPPQRLKAPCRQHVWLLKLMAEGFASAPRSDIGKSGNRSEFIQFDPVRRTTAVDCSRYPTDS